MQKILKQELILQIMNWKDHYLKEKRMKLMQDKLRGKMMITFAVLRANVYCFLKMVVTKRKKQKAEKSL